MTYQFGVSDTSGNVAKTPSVSIAIIDNSYPNVIIEDLSPIMGTTGDIYEFRVSNLSAEVEPPEYEYLELREDGRLNYVSQGSGHTSRAILERQ